MHPVTSSFHSLGYSKKFFLKGTAKPSQSADTLTPTKSKKLKSLRKIEEKLLILSRSLSELQAKRFSQ